MDGVARTGIIVWWMTWRALVHCVVDDVASTAPAYLADWGLVYRPTVRARSVPIS